MASLSRKQFDILSLLESKQTALTQRVLSGQTGYSLGTVNKALKQLTDLGYIENGKINQPGINALEPYRAKRAVFLAAGVGSRLMPVSLNTPKPLVRVKGKRMIDGLIDACLAVGIEEIVVVRGYFAYQFNELLEKYPMIKFVENPVYNETNDISSAYFTRDLMCNAYVFESDLVLKNPSLVRKYHYTSDFLGIYKERSEDWCFETENGIIKEEKLGGLNCYQMVGISYWNEQDGKKLFNHIKQAFEMPGGKERYWEQVPLTFFKSEYRVEVIPCKEDDVIEIDTFNELKAADPAYAVK